MSQPTSQLTSQPGQPGQPGQPTSQPAGQVVSQVAASPADGLAAREAACLAALSGQPDLSRNLLQLAEIRLEQRRFDVAAALARACLALPDDVSPQFEPGAAAGVLGVALSRAGQYAQAVEVLEPALAQNPQALAVRLALARALLVQDRIGDAGALFESAVDGLAGAEARCVHGRVLFAAKQPLEALRAFEAALALTPGYGEALVGRGLALMALGRSASALVSLNEAVTAAPEDPEPASELGLALGRVGFLNEAVKWFERALKIDRHYAPAYRYMGNALTMMRLDREALVCLREARRLRPDWNEAWLDEAGLLLRAGRLQEGWQAYERRQSASMARRLAGDHYWLGDADLTDQSIILMAEQGLGDTLNFVRYAPLIKAMGAARVIVEVQRSLLPLIEPQAQAWGVEVIGRGTPHPPTQWQTLLLSLPHAYGTKASTIPSGVPYLSVPALYREKWRDALGPRRGMRIGLVCAGNPHYPDDAIRSTRLEVFKPLLELAGVEWVWLQPDIRPGDRATLDAYAQVNRIGESFTDFADTAAVVEQLDLVISVDTSVAHLAGALGRPVWILISFLPDWRWMLDREDTPWYPSATLFRQPASGDWPGLLQNVLTALQARLLSASASASA
ncbi:tetratricopeptide repeat protein [Burkholderia sp. L27(2015)]|uniref:tetratricopeptide repeat protein n=1 Tax=Burkholderia sp. L27(2015) TaxID=1641858 RepID=UPI00131ABEE5|nr:tetratricopeptide repeat protein [Burkholderia sp. L27(2015)]